MRHAHTASEEKKFRCDTCGKGFGANNAKKNPNLKCKISGL